MIEAQQPFRVAVISDINGSYGSVGYDHRVGNAIRRIVELRPDLVLITGDMIAGQRPGRPLSPAQLDESWSAFNSSVLDPLLAAGIAVAPSPGNHDAAPGEIYQGERRAFAQQWLAHKTGIEEIEGDYPFTYGFRRGPAFFVSVEAISPAGLSNASLRHLEDLLQNAERWWATPPQLVVFGHLPLAAVARGREAEYLRDTAMLATLKAHKTTLYLSGHHHAFYDGCVDGIRQVSVGALASPRALLATNQRTAPNFVLLTWRNGAVVEVQALAAPEFREEVTLADLPQSLSTGGRLIVRMDIANGCHVGN